jgi:ABC-type multidrug transport system fused ATPase/permease subunit
MKNILNTLRELLPLLPDGARRFFFWYMSATSALTALDVVAMALLALVITPAVNSAPIDLPFIGELPTTATPAVVLIACALIILKSALSVLLHWIATRRFARYEFAIGQRLFRAYIHSTWEERSKRSVAEITRIADAGIANTMMGFVLPLSLLPGYTLTFFLIIGVLVVSQPLTAFVALGYLALVALVVSKVIMRRSLEASTVNRTFGYKVANLMSEMVEALKELTLRDRLSQVAGVVDVNRQRAVRARANLSFLSIIPRYSFEAALIGGFLLVGIATYFTSGLNGAVAAIALFAATGFRLIPAIAGVQSSLLDATKTIPFANDVINDIRNSEAHAAEQQEGTDSAVLPDQPAMLHLSSIEFRYPGADESVLKGLDLEIPLGSSLGIVGPSGAGKSTLIDLLLGLSAPSGGAIMIDGQPLATVIKAWRSRVGYVPQRVALFDASIAQNVALTWDDDFDHDRVIDSLERAQLMPLVKSRAHGIHERIGERGVSLSGGQQQRLGIARALYSRPLVLVLDEATSSLDTKTEDDVTRAIRELRGEITLISVAHRISTIKDYDQIAYVDGGRILGKGTFSGLAEELPQFGLQVALAGLGTGPLASDPKPDET